MRSLLLRALLLDCLGQVLILSLTLWHPFLAGISIGTISLQGQGPWLAFLLFIYPLLGWLLGIYTVLRWRRLPFLVLLQRLLITALATLLFVSIACWLINPSDSVWLVYRRVQLFWICSLTLWVLLVRVTMRRGLFLPEEPRLLLFAQQHELENLLKAWRRVPQRLHLCPVNSFQLSEKLNSSREPLLVVLSKGVRQDPSLRSLLAKLELFDPRQVRPLSLLGLFEQYQQRLPPALIENTDTELAYEDLPWTATFSVQTQLKRMADLFMAALLILLTTPFVLFAALLIWLEDRGPVFYAQQRSGWLGRPFTVYKLRTMSVQPVDAPARWTEPGDLRITAVGVWLRRFRLDELPQLFNVLNGEMSLIGPRPERPELEEELEQRIPCYRKRHWMRPGLSGWAQVCAPYASSIEDSDLKLSYDLYYLRHFSAWLDLVILFRTVKTVLKAGGR